MRYRGIVITGTSGSGKSTLAAELSEQDDRFRVVKAVTTRATRNDDPPDAYEHVTAEVFDRLLAHNELLVEASYRGRRYGIRIAEVLEAEQAGRVPVLVITPDSAATLCGMGSARDETSRSPVNSFLSVFVDGPDEELDQRLARRGHEHPDPSTVQQRTADRKREPEFVYSLKNPSPDRAARLVAALWDDAGSGGVLPARLIRLMLECGTLLDGAILDNTSGASYDLCLGDEYFYGGKMHRLTDHEPILLIEPYDYAIVTSHETADLPGDICGRFDLSVSLFCQGILLSNGPQVDPGFRGPLFCLLLNTSSSPVMLKRRLHYATLEFHKLVEPTYRYSGHYQDKGLLHYLPANAAWGAINELKKELEKVRQESGLLRDMTWAILSLILALIAVWVTLK